MPEKHQKSDSKTELSKFQEIELGKLLDATNSLNSLRVQIGGVFGAATFAVIGAAISNQKAGLFFIGASLQVVFIYLDASIRSSLAAYYFRGLDLQSRCAQKDKDVFLGTYISLQPKLVSFIQKLLNSNDIQKRNKSLRSIGFRFPSLAGFWFPMVALVIETALGIYLLQSGSTNGWKIF